MYSLIPNTYNTLMAKESYPGNSEVEANGCGALTNLVRLEANTEYIFKELNGAERIVAAMNRFKDHSKVQKWGSWSLNNLLICWGRFQRFHCGGWWAARPF